MQAAMFAQEPPSIIQLKAVETKLVFKKVVSLHIIHHIESQCTVQLEFMELII